MTTQKLKFINQNYKRTTYHDVQIGDLKRYEDDDDIK